jgi:hypothetical protein
MRCLVVGVILLLELASIDGVSAQTARTPSSSPPTSTANIQEQHPEWFATKGAYRPCPASVTFSNGRNACLGCPTRCSFHF